MPTVTLFGLGIMGSAMGRHMLAAGLTVTAHDPDSARTGAFIDGGGRVAISPADACEAAEVIVTSLPTADAVREVCTAIAAHAQPGTIVAETSTMPITLKSECLGLLTESGMTLLDCPLSGTGSQARERDVVVYGSGDETAFTCARPVLESFSRSVRYLGAFGNGSIMKFIANLLVAVHNVATAEAFSLGIRAGLDRTVLWETIRDGAGNSVIFDKRGHLMITEDYWPATAKMSMFVKDVDIVQNYARELEAATPLLDAVAVLYDQAVASGLADADAAALLSVLAAQQANATHRPGP